MRFVQSLAKQTHHATAMVDGHIDRLPCTQKRGFTLKAFFAFILGWFGVTFLRVSRLRVPICISGRLQSFRNWVGHGLKNGAEK